MPFALLLFAVLMVISSTLLMLYSTFAQREGARIDMINAYNLAHAGFEQEVSYAYAGKSAVIDHVYSSEGEYSARILGYFQKNVVQIKAEGLTRLGAQATIIASVDTASHTVLSWLQTP
ncbi:hypothetical protein BM613_01570 [Sulfoacidibacillus thermotolerans]|uniref:Uncharacterized protein n=1 Tax=Sulfoacidibacillus thermotolerans TaxID=1765684 RepID=A0A2U3DBY9_SULT2|nr:hypothetical protein BM613_01570 [Sulfoacidibacillus thermotolerans]